MTKQNHSSHGFTLIELLVVVAIIVILIAILLPSLGQARNQAKITACQANLRSIAMAELTYASEYNIFPYLRNNATSPASGPSWANLIYVNMNDNYKAFLCPADKTPQSAWYNPQNINTYRSSYGVNMSIVAGTKEDYDYDGIVGSVKPTMIANPSEKILNIEVHFSENIIGGIDYAGYAGIHFYWAYRGGTVDTSFLTPNFPDRYTPNGENHQRMANSTGANYSYADGHAGWVDYKDMKKWLSGTWNSTLIFNANNPWHILQ